MWSKACDEFARTVSEFAPHLKPGDAAEADPEDPWDTKNWSSEPAPWPAGRGSGASGSAGSAATRRAGFSDATLELSRRLNRIRKFAEEAKG